MSNLCETSERPIKGTTMTIETRVYEDGYVQVTIIDQLGLEVDSIDGNTRLVGHLEDILLDRYI